MSAEPTSPAQVGSIWQHKPWWCQPWSILLTGLAAMGLSWIWLQHWWITALVSAAVLVWWVLFLVLVPRAWKAAAEAGEQIT
jgi:hypothetical protein